MKFNIEDHIKHLKQIGMTPEQEVHVRRELSMWLSEEELEPDFGDFEAYNDLYFKFNDYTAIIKSLLPESPMICSLKTLEELLQNDKQRELDGLPRRIKLGKLMRPGKGKKAKVVVVPSTTEPKFYHDDSITEDGEGSESGGSGEGEEGEVIGQQQAEPEQGEGEGQGAGQGEGGGHDIAQDAFDLGKVLTEKFELPNIREKGKKVSLTKYTYDLTDRNRGFGQVLDKKATLRRIVETNIQLGNIEPNGDVDTSKLVINPQDLIYRILSKEKDYESQAVVFFVRDYSGSMQGKPTEVVGTQHLLIYSWLMYQYQNNVMTRFILHDTEAKEVPDFYTYYRSQVAGGTNIHPAYDLVNKIVFNERLDKDYNIYMFHGTDGDDWDESGQKAIEALKVMFGYVSRIGITVAKNSWGSGKSTYIENYIERSNMLKEHPDLIRLDSFSATEAEENRIVEGIKKLIS